MTFHRKLGIVLATLLLASAPLSVAPCSVSAAEPIKIGVLDTFSGPFSHSGPAITAGMKFAVDEQNANGGLFGRRIELVIEDHEMKADVGLRKAKKLILEDKVDFLSVGTGSHVSLATMKFADANKKLLFTTHGAAEAITGKEFSRYVFRIGHQNYGYTAGMLQLLADTPYRKFYLLNMDYAAGRDFSAHFVKNIKTYIPDAEVVGEDFPPLNNKDFAPYVTKVINSKADAVVTMSWGPDLTLMIKQGRSLGLKAPFPFVAVFAAEPYFGTDLKDDMAGNWGIALYDMRINTPENQKFVAAYHEQHKNDKDFNTWWPYGVIGAAYSGWKMTLAGIEKAGSLDTEKIISTLEGFSYKTVVGTWTIRACDHTTLYPLFGFRVQGGQNPYYNGSIRPDVKFPWYGPNYVTIAADKVEMPATAAYNPRCK
jgi:branched-chain amino acid transport system substrate-binding protein